MSRRDLRLLLAVCALGAVWPIAHGIAGLGTGVLFLVPALAMALPLLAGRYIGAEALERISRSLPRRRRRVPTAHPVRRAFRLTFPRGGLLIAASLAVRPPPLALSAD
jgi:hypothetical protein